MYMNGTHVKNNSSVQIDHLIGKVVRVFGSGQKTNRWLAGILRNANGLDVRFSGTADTIVTVGSMIEFDAIAETTAYGLQYVALKGTLIHRVITGRVEIIAFLSSDIFPGIGQKTAEKIYSVYGGMTLPSLWACKNSNFERNQFKKSTGVTDRQLDILLDGLAADKLFTRLIQAFPHMRPPVAHKIADKVHEQSLDVVVDEIIRQPYLMLGDEYNVNLGDVDMIATNDIKVQPYDYRRISYMLKRALHRFCADKHATFVRISDSKEWSAFFTEYFTRMPFAYPLPFYWDGEQLSANCLARHVKTWYDTGFMDSVSLSDLRQDQNGNFEVALYSTPMKRAEEDIVKHFKASLCPDSVTENMLLQRHQNFVQWNRQLKQNGKQGLSVEQQFAVGMVYQKKISFISGGPGRGKTSALRFLIESWMSLVGPNIVCLAPTGKAVNRLKAQTDYEKIGTVMRFLVLNKVVANHQLVDVHRNVIPNKLSTLVVVDEVSMLNFVDAAKLLNYVSDCTVVFVGDKDQLSPIEPGPFLQECLASVAVPRVILTQNFRTKSRVINDNAELILTGAELKKLDFTDFDSFSVLASDEMPLNDTDVMSPAETYILDKYMQCLHDGADFSDVMVIAPFAASKYRLSSYNLNVLIQNKVNPKSDTNTASNQQMGVDSIGRYITKKGAVHGIKDMDGLELRIGDRVMNVKNNMDVVRASFKNDDVWNTGSMLPDNDTMHGIYNGDVGTIVRYYMSTQQCPGGSVLIALDDTRAPELRASDPRPVQYVHIPADIDRFGNIKLSDWCLGYALSVHKAQGSEADYVIIALSQRGYEATNYRTAYGSLPFLTRNMIYTAITRAKSSVSVVGSVDALKACIATPYEFSNVRLGYELDCALL